MKAVWYDRQGPAEDVLVFGEMPTPHAGLGQVRVKLHASGVNPSDCYRRRGGEMEFPRVIAHSDGAGVVDEVGEGVDRALRGKRVWLYNGQRNGRAFGTAAEYIALDASLVSPLPEPVSFVEAATLGIPCMTAHVCLFVAGAVQGKTVLVTGGAGAVGHYAIQLAKWAGARVIATASNDKKAKHAKAGGADLVLDHRSENVVARVLEFTRGEGVDHIVDVDFGGNLETSLALIANQGSIVGYASDGERMPKVPFLDLMWKNIAVYGMVLPTSRLEARRRAQSDITRWLDTRPILTVSDTFSLAETVKAHEAVERGDKHGTVVVEIA
jgi:NADPH2:quinone reductase